MALSCTWKIRCRSSRFRWSSLTRCAALHFVGSNAHFSVCMRHPGSSCSADPGLTTCHQYVPEAQSAGDASDCSRMFSAALQEDWDEEQDPEFFRLGGSVPQATSKGPGEAGALSHPFFIGATWCWARA